MFGSKTESPINETSIDKDIASLFSDSTGLGSVTTQDLFAPTPLPFAAHDILGGLVSAQALMEAELSPLEFVIDGVLPVGLTILGGAPKSGKSFLALDIARAVASGTCFLGKYHANAGKVLYITYEDTERRLQTRLLQKTSGGGVHLANLLFHYRWPDFEHRGLEQLENLVPHIEGVKLVVIDTLGCFLGAGAKQGYTHQYQVMAQISQVANKLGVSILVIHHTVKTKAKNWRQALYGTNAVSGGADGLMMLERIGEGKYANFMVSGRDVEDESLTLWLDKGAWKMGEHPAEEVELLGKEGQAEIYKALMASGEPMRVKEIAKATGKSEPNVSGRLKDMVAQGLITRTANGGTPRYGIQAGGATTEQ
jgi:hypothetical protein